MKTRVIIEMEIVPDQDPDSSYLEQDGFEDRLAAYHRGEFGYVGVRAKATIETPYGADTIASHMTSPGVWGIEDDSEREYITEVFKEEKAILLEMLESLKDLEIMEVQPA